MGRGRCASLVQDVREIAAQQPGKAYDFVQDARSVFEQESFSHSSGTTPSTLSRTGLLTLMSPTQSPLLNEDDPKCEAFPSLDSYDGAAGPSPDAKGPSPDAKGPSPDAKGPSPDAKGPSPDAEGWFPGALLQDLSAEPPGYGSPRRPRRLKRLYIATPAPSPPVAPVSIASVRSAFSGSSSRSRRFTPVNVRVASSTGHGSAGSPVHRPLAAEDLCDECLLNGEEASSITILAEELQADILPPRSPPTDIKILPAACMQATVAQPVHIPRPSKPAFPRCQSLPERTVSTYPSPFTAKYRSPSLVRQKALSPDPPFPVFCDVPHVAVTAAPVPTPTPAAPTSHTDTTATCRVSLKLQSAHVDMLRLNAVRALAQLLLPFGWALRGMGIRPGCIELVLDYTRVEDLAHSTNTSADAGAPASDSDRVAQMSTRAPADAAQTSADHGGEAASVSERHLTQLVSFLHQYGLVDEVAEPYVIMQANQQLHRVQWQQPPLPAASQRAQPTPSPDLAACMMDRPQQQGALLVTPPPPTEEQLRHASPGTGAGFGKALDGIWLCSGAPTSLGPAASLEPVVLPSCVMAPCAARGPGTSVVLYVGVPRRGLQGCTVRSLGRFLPTRELLLVSAVAAMAAMDMATITEDGPANADAVLAGGKAPLGVPCKDSKVLSNGRGGSSSCDAHLEVVETEPASTIDWQLAGAAAQAVGVDGEVLILSVGELPAYGALLQVELRVPLADGRGAGSLSSVSWRTSGKTMESANEAHGSSAVSQLGLHIADMGLEGAPAPMPTTLEPLTAAALVILLRGCQCSKAGNGTGGGHRQGTADGVTVPHHCGDLWAVTGAVREISCLRARMAVSALVSGPGTGAAAAEFLTDLGLLLDVAACTAMMEGNRVAGRTGPGTSSRYKGTTATASATQMSQEAGDAGAWHEEDTGQMTYEEQVRAVLLAQLGGGAGSNGIEPGGAGGLGGASLPLGQHLADTAVTLLAACAEMSLPYTAQLVMQLAVGRLRLGDPEVLLQAAADGDVAFLFRLLLLLVEAEMPAPAPTHNNPRPADAVNMGEPMAMAAATRAEAASSLGDAAGPGVVRVACLPQSLMLPAAQRHASRQGLAAAGAVTEEARSGGGGGSLGNVIAHNSARVATSGSVVFTPPQPSSSIHSVASGTPLPRCLSILTHTHSDAVDVPTTTITSPVFQSQPSSECFSAVALDDEDAFTLQEDMDVRPNDGGPLLTADCGMTDAARHPGGPPAPIEAVGAAMQLPSPVVTGSCFKAGSHKTASCGWDSAPAVGAARHVQGSGPVSNGLLQQFGKQVLASVVGTASTATEQAFWRDAAAGLQDVSRLYAYVTLVLVSLSASRAGLEDGLSTALFMVLYQGGQAVLLAAYGQWGHGRPDRLISAVTAAVVLRSTCHALLSWGLAPLPSFVRPVSRAWGDLLNEAGAKAVFEQLPFWMYLTLLLFVELPTVYALYSYLDSHGQGLLTRSVPMRLACFIVLKTSVTLAAQAVMRMRFQARRPRVKCE